MGHSLGDAIIVASIAAALLGYGYLKSRERQRRIEIWHETRLAAIAKGVPLVELPPEPLLTDSHGPADPQVLLIVGIVLASFAASAMIALAMVGFRYWPMPLPIASIGGGLMLYHFLAAGRPS
jgi:hypothetical protein